MCLQVVGQYNELNLKSIPKVISILNYVIIWQLIEPSALGTSPDCSWATGPRLRGCTF